jgi:methionyl-tRNA formyltransferase
MQMDQGLDTGPMLSMQKLPIMPDDTTGSMHDKLAQLGGEMIVKVLRQLELDQLEATAQPETGVTYAAKISKEEAALNFTLTAKELERKIRAFNPFPGAYANVNGTIVKIWAAQATENLNLSGATLSGQVLAANAHDGLLLSCEEGNSVLRLTELQKSGGKRLPVAEFLKGFAILPGQFFTS